MSTWMSMTLILGGAAVVAIALLAVLISFLSARIPELDF